MKNKIYFSYGSDSDVDMGQLKHPPLKEKSPGKSPEKSPPRVDNTVVDLTDEGFSKLNKDAVKMKVKEFNL